MSLLAGIGAAVSAATAPLTIPATLSQDGVETKIRVSRHKRPSPQRAAQTGRQFDALIRINGQSLSVEPEQNDRIMVEGDVWIVWRLNPSAAGAYIRAECMALPVDLVTPNIMVKVSDGAGGETMTAQAQTPILAKIYGLTVEKALTASSNEASSRIMLQWPYDSTETEIETGLSMTVRDILYSVQSVGIDPENPLWRRATLARVV
jgi:hypothetical protein